MPSTRRGRAWPAKPAIMPACVLPVTLQTTIGVEEDAELALLLLDLVRPVGETETAEPVVGGAGRDRRTARRRLRRTSASACSQLCLNPMPKPASTSSTSAPMMRDSRMLPTRSLTASGQSTQLSWTSRALSPSPGRDRGHLPGVVGLDPADRHQVVGTCGQRVGDEVLQLAGLVAAEGQARVAVLPFGPDPGTTEVLAESIQRMHRTGPEQQRIPRELCQPHDLPPRRRCTIEPTTFDPTTQTATTTAHCSQSNTVSRPENSRWTAANGVVHSRIERSTGAVPRSR